MGTRPGNGTDTHIPSAGTDPQHGGLSVAEAAVTLGVSVNTIRRWIKDGRIRSERVATPTGYAYRVYTDTVPVTGTHAGVGTSTSSGNATGAQRQASVITMETQRAEAMATYSRALLEPLVARLGEQEAIIREQAERVGRQAEQLAGLDNKLALAEEYIRALEASAPQNGQQRASASNLTAEGPEPPLETPTPPPPAPVPSPTPEPVPPSAPEPMPPPRPPDKNGRGRGWRSRVAARLMA